MIKNPAHPDEPICQYLRSKASAIPMFDNVFYMEHQYDYEQFYCQKTLYPIGPDDRPVCPEECHMKRQCFTPHPAFQLLAQGAKDDSAKG